MAESSEFLNKDWKFFTCGIGAKFMTDAQLEKFFERVLTKLEEIRCGLIDIETLLEEKNTILPTINSQVLSELRVSTLKAIAEISAHVAENASKGIEEMNNGT